jgi:ABC-type multidrug transport system fused ATPase/permease subunit
MNIVSFLLTKFFKEEYLKIAILIIISLLLTVLQTNGISFITANIIENIQNHNIADVFLNYKYFIYITIGYLALYYIYKYIQTQVMQKLLQWIRYELFRLILVVNNENMSNENFVNFFTPISRISMQIYNLLTNMVSTLVPTVAFLIVIFGYFIYKNTLLGTCFLFGNILIILYVAFFWKDMLKQKQHQESILNKNDIHITDIFSNIDKVIYRGQILNEIESYTTLNNSCINTSISYMNYIINHNIMLNGIVYSIIFSSIFYLIKLRQSNHIDIITFISFFTILLMYRDKATYLISDIPEYIDFVGRIEYITTKFNIMIGNKKNIDELLDKQYDAYTLKFSRIRFDNVSFKYEGTEKMILKNFNIDLDVNDKIIGLVGLSGKGKSSFVKLILRLYDCTEGDIYIDDTDISKIDPNYIRSNITYVNQNSKLFDKKVIENILYGCSHLEKCNEHLKEILQYSKIQELFKNVNIHETSAGSLGENLSGGQRQIVNIISGLINPSKILILDEPTNALDPELKRQLLSILAKFKKYKKSIIIITHDKDVHSLFDETIQL